MEGLHFPFVGGSICSNHRLGRAIATGTGDLNVEFSSPKTINPTVPSGIRRRWFGALAIAWLHWISLSAFVVALAAAAAGLLLDDSLALAAAGFAVSLGFVATDLSRAQRQNISPATLMATASMLVSLGHIVAVLHANDSGRARYFVYTIDEHVPLALKISFAACVLPVLGFHWVRRSGIMPSFVRLLPIVEGRIGLRKLIPVLVFAGILGIALKVTGALTSFGTLTALAYGMPNLAAFVLARAGAARNWRAAILAGLVIALAEAARALFFAYLRADVISPIFAYSAGLVLGARSLRPLKRPEFIPVYAAAVLFVVYFAAFGAVRSGGAGVDRLISLQSYQEALATEETRPRQTVLARLTTFNQLTQVVRVAREDGFLYGETLEYLGIAFIPRFLWPEKPEIAKGAWFALRIGQARMYRGRITNSVNMTVAGEFYLNFGWLGVIIGTFLFGSVIGIFWSKTEFWRDPYNVLGTGFGYYLLWTGFVGAADLQTLVTLVALYMIFVALSLLARAFEASKPEVRQIESRSTHVGTPPTARYLRGG